MTPKSSEHWTSWRSHAPMRLSSRQSTAATAPNSAASWASGRGVLDGRLRRAVAPARVAPLRIVLLVRELTLDADRRAAAKIIRANGRDTERGLDVQLYHQALHRRGDPVCKKIPTGIIDARNDDRVLVDRAVRHGSRIDRVDNRPRTACGEQPPADLNLQLSHFIRRALCRDTTLGVALRIDEGEVQCAQLDEPLRQGPHERAKADCQEVFPLQAQPLCGRQRTVQPKASRI